MGRKITGLILGISLCSWLLFSLVASVTSRVHKRYAGCEFAMAIGNEDLPRIYQILEQGADPNTDVYSFASDSGCSGQVWGTTSDAVNMPALLYALHPQKTSHDIGNTRMATLLLNAGADVNITDAQGNTPLIVAARAGNLEIVKLLLAKQANTQMVNNKGQTALAEAQQMKHPNIVALLQKGSK